MYNAAVCCPAPLSTHAQALLECKADAMKSVRAGGPGRHGVPNPPTINLTVGACLALLRAQCEHGVEELAPPVKSVHTIPHPAHGCIVRRAGQHTAALYVGQGSTPLYCTSGRAAHGCIVCWDRVKGLNLTLKSKRKEQTDPALTASAGAQGGGTDHPPV
eukprot:356529-Chlamydomonas_euryale.AAC.6